MSEKKTVTFQASAKPRKVKKKIEAMQDAGQSNAVSMPVRDDNEDGEPEIEIIPLRSRDHPDEQFPTDALQLRDKGDALLGQKLAMQQEGKPGVTPLGQLIAKDSDFELLRKKRDLEAYANFQVSRSYLLNWVEREIARRLQTTHTLRTLAPALSFATQVFGCSFPYHVGMIQTV